MSEGPKTEAPFFSEIKDRVVFLGWIGGLILMGGIVWFLTQPLRTQVLMRSVNRVLSLGEDQRRLQAPLSLPRPSGSAAPQGNWYSLINSEDFFFVFPLMRDGLLVLCGAQVTQEGKVVGIVPLSDHAKQVFKDIPEGFIQIYIRRIEALRFKTEGEKR